MVITYDTLLLNHTHMLIFLESCGNLLLESIT